MASLTTKFDFGFRLISGKPNMRDFPEKSSQTFRRGDLVKLSSGQVAEFTTPRDSTKTTTISAGVWGVAAADANNDTNNAYFPVMVVSPEQVWAVHALPGIKPSTKATYDEGKNVKIKYSASASYTLSDGNSNTNKTTVGAWQAQSVAATADGKGIVIVGYPDRVGGTKGGEMLVRFGRHTADGGY